MNQDQVKSLLLEIENTQLEFNVIFSGKESKRVNGLYKPDSYEIILHNHNFKTDNQLIYTAIHEYTHHLLNEAQVAKTAGLKPLKYGRVHTNDFWARFHNLLDSAEERGLYVMGLEDVPELAELTENIRKNYLEKNGTLMKEFGQLLVRAHELCSLSNIRYEDYIDRCLKIPRCAARSITKVGGIEVSPVLGYENMKMIAAIPSSEKRAEAQEQLLAGKSPDSVRSTMKKKSEEIDVKTRLEKEKLRLEKTIFQLSGRLELVEESLANL